MRNLLAALLGITGSVFLPCIMAAVPLSTNPGLPTASVIQQLVNAHNAVRTNVTPVATGMQKLTWDPAIAAMAQNYAETCVWGHNGNRNAFGESLGENIFVGTWGYYTAVDSVGSWASESADYTFNTNTCGAGKVCGHYTQVVWASTKRIGCGVAKCPTMTGGMSNAIYVVCDYAPPGNWQGQSPYSTGSACSACASPTPCDSTTKLCMAASYPSTCSQCRNGYNTCVSDTYCVWGNATSNATTPGASSSSARFGVGLSSLLMMLAATFLM